MPAHSADSSLPLREPEHAADHVRYSLDDVHDNPGQAREKIFNARRA
jgi:hypothetical protein